MNEKYLVFCGLEILNDDTWKEPLISGFRHNHKVFVKSKIESERYYSAPDICLFCEAQKYGRDLKEILQIFETPRNSDKQILEFWKNGCNAWGEYDQVNLKPAKNT
jgi:hypothetical protein